MLAGSFHNHIFYIWWSHFFVPTAKALKHKHDIDNKKSLVECGVANSKISHSQGSSLGCCVSYLLEYMFPFYFKRVDLDTARNIRWISIITYTPSSRGVVRDHRKNIKQLMIFMLNMYINTSHKRLADKILILKIEIDVLKFLWNWWTCSPTSTTFTKTCSVCSIVAEYSKSLYLIHAGGS